MEIQGFDSTATKCESETERNMSPLMINVFTSFATKCKKTTCCCEASKHFKILNVFRTLI